MDRTTHLLIGGGLASSQAAKILRAKDPDASITLVSDEPHLPYDRPPLSKELLRGEKSAADLEFDPPSFFAEQHITTMTGQRVENLRLDDKVAVLGDGREIAFEKAFIGTGGRPRRLRVPGADLGGVYYLRTLEDAAAIAAEAGDGRRVVVVGAGFIGIEVAASLAQLGANVTVVEALPRIWPRFLDERLSSHVHDHCMTRGIQFLTSEKVTALVGNDRVAAVKTASGASLPCDFVCVGIGIRPEVSLAERAGLEVMRGIVVDERMRTSHPDIFAGGDVINFPDPIFGKRRQVEHWGHAEYCGQVAGLNMAGIDQVYDLLTYVWSDVFDLHIESAGDETTYDRTLIRGDVEQDSFFVLYLTDDRLTAYFAVNGNRREYPRLQKLIRRHVDLAGRDDALRDPDFDLRTLL